jgi:hypothetical protein
LNSYEDSKRAINGSIGSSSLDFLGNILGNLAELAPPFYTITHGDCHARNILLRKRDLDLKIIDIDNLEDQGDYIYDYGTLLADLETFNLILQSREPCFKLSIVEGSVSYEIQNNCNADIAISVISERLEEIADETGDKNWKKRLKLAKARYLFSMVSKLSDEEKAC